jgi:adenylate cyclase class 2
VLEVEAKFPAPDFGGLERRLADWGAAGGEILHEADHYFNAPDRDFARTDEALRLRRVGDANFVTYKGPKRDAQTKTRAEIEVPLANGDGAADDFGRLLQHLGYRPVAVVEKTRRIYRLRRGGFAMEVCLDEVAEVGRYVELEIQAPEERLDAARDVLLRAAGDLGLTNSERRSYLEMLLARRGERSS